MTCTVAYWDLKIILYWCWKPKPKYLVEQLLVLHLTCPASYFFPIILIIFVFSFGKKLLEMIYLAIYFYGDFFLSVKTNVHKFYVFEMSTYDIPYYNNIHFFIANKWNYGYLYLQFNLNQSRAFAHPWFLVAQP